jgi:hypothetical protein
MQLKLGDCALAIFPTVKGLASELPELEAAWAAARPQALALGVSPGEVAGLREWDGEPFDISGWEELYGLALRQVAGDDGVRLPPPAFRRALALADEGSVPVEPLDLPEEEFTALFTDSVSTWQWFRCDRLEKRLRKRGFEAATPQDLALEMDRHLCGLSGYAAIERGREAEMARRLREACAERQRVLAIIELPRVARVVDLLPQA